MNLDILEKDGPDVNLDILEEDGPEEVNLDILEEDGPEPGYEAVGREAD